MCNLSEAIEENAIYLVKKVLSFSAEGMSDAEIAEICGITEEKVQKILEV